MQLLIVLLGLIIGSFLSAFTYRFPRNISINKGRSKCPKCKKKIMWHDNIPLISYLVLRGKSRCCKKPISPRYPLIELGTALSFLGTFWMYLSCGESIFCSDLQIVGIGVLPLYLLVVSLLVGIFVIDFEHQIIPDEFVFILLAIASSVVLIRHEDLYVSLLSGFGASLFLLLLNLFTKGKGMGLGDVKLAIPLGLLLGWSDTFVWMTVSFVLGAVVGVLLIAVGKAKFGRHIPFGPFLVIGFLLVLFVSQTLIPPLLLVP